MELKVLRDTVTRPVIGRLWDAPPGVLWLFRYRQTWNPERSRQVSPPKAA
jgi:hypothetical protein